MSRFSIVRGSLFFLLSCAYILVFFHRMAPGAIAGDLMESFNTTGASLGTLAATYFLVYSFMQVPSGVLADTLGMRTSLILGNLVSGIGSILFGTAETFAAAGVGRLLVGLGVSVIFISILKFNSLWFSERRFALLAGITGLTGNVGAVLAAGPLTVLLGFVTWRWVFIGVGILSLSISLISLVIVRNTPADYGFPPLAVINRHESHHWFTELKAVLKNPHIWPGFWSNFGIIGSAYAFMGLWGIPYLKSGHSMSQAGASSCITVMLATSAFGALFFGWLSDSIGKRKPVLVTSNILYAVTLILAVLLPLHHGIQVYILFGLLGLFCTGSVLTLTCAKEVANPLRAGTATSVVNTGTFLGTLLLQPLFGWVLDFSWDGAVTDGVRVYSLAGYRWGMVLFIGFACTGIAGSLLIRETNCRNVYVKS